MTRNIQIVSFTATGARLAAQLAEAFGGQAFAPANHCAEGVLPLEETVGEWTARRFHSVRALVYIGAAGIAVRAVGPLARSKGSDPAVVCVEETGRFVVPLLSGHIGGANALAREIANITGGVAVITTATDTNNVFSVDAWAVENGCAVPETAGIKAVSAAFLAGETVGLHSDFPVRGALPKGLEQRTDTRSGICIGLQKKKVFAETLWLAPKCLRLGVGCRKGVDRQALEQAVWNALEEAQLPIEAVNAVATVTLKEKEPALLAFCKQRRLPLKAYAPERLALVSGSVSGSDFVRSVTGVDNVCERAALAEGGELIVPKKARCGVTVAVVKQDWSAVFCN